MRIEYFVNVEVNSNSVLDVNTFVDTYLYDLFTHTDHIFDKLNTSSIRRVLLDAERHLMNNFQLKLYPQAYRESKNLQKIRSRGYLSLSTTYPVKLSISIDFTIVRYTLYSYGSQWLSHHRREGEDVEKAYKRRMHLIPHYLYLQPGAGSGDFDLNVNSFLYSLYLYGLANSDSFPELIDLTYITGFISVPDELLSYMYEYARLQLLPQIGNLFYPPHIQSASQSIDSLSQSIAGTGSSHGGPLAGIRKEYEMALKDRERVIKEQYCPIKMAAA